MDAVSWRRSWESFSVYDAGKGEIALHCDVFNRFVRMRDIDKVDASGASKTLPAGWTWERFKPVQVLLKPGSEIALHNSIFNRFMRMHGDANKMDSSDVKNINALPDGWTWERFKVVEAGFGQVALHSSIHNRFVRMWDGDMDRSSNKDAGALPDGWWAERFTVVDCGGGKVAFHNARFNRFVRMNHGDMDRSATKAGDALPSGWTWECFTPIEAFTCKTGSGSSCRSCVAPGSRTATDHCNSCNAGYALVGRVCKSEHAVTSAPSARGDDKTTTATCPAGMYIKKCEVIKVGSGNLADGAVVSDDATKCTAQSTFPDMRVKAKASCSTKKTYAISTPTWRTGTKTASCAKPLSCNCRSAWRVKDQCWSGHQTAATFNPSQGKCTRKSGSKGIQVTAVCEVLACSTGANAGCKSCVGERDRQVVNHCASCNPGYYLDGGVCKAYSCHKTLGSGCASCRAQNQRTAHNQCASCNFGWALVGTQCKDDHVVLSGFSGSRDDDTTAATCPNGMYAHKCEVVEVQGAGGGRRRRRGQNSKLGDGLDVPNAQTCTAITTTGVKLKSKAHCSTTETVIADSGSRWKKGWVEVGCSKGDAVSCTCWSAWRVNDYCKAGPNNNGWAATFKPIRGKCKRFSPGGGHRIKVHAICSMERCSSFAGCPDGYHSKPLTTIGSSVDGCCTPAACPAGSTGTDVPSGCTCSAGYTGSIAVSGKSPFYTGSCAAVDCPDNSEGSNVPSGCACKAGYSGKITATSSSPFYSGTCVETCALFTCPKGYKPKAITTVANSLSGCCEPVDCPAGSSGTAVHSGCSCDAGHSGTISATSSAPYFSGTCSTVACPDNSEGAHVPSGCTCNAGYSGAIKASKASPFYTGSCAAVACPADSSGKDVPSGCSCNVGFSGKIKSSATSPFYTGKCAAVDCPAHSSGSNVPAGCACDAGFKGSITAAASSPFYSGKCEAVACPKHSTGADVPSGCKCKNGYKGQIKAATASPFFTGKCTPVGCPDNTEGNNVPGGCDCLAGFSGEIEGDDSRPWYTGKCEAQACPAGSSGTDLPSGCTCDAGYSGSVTAVKTSPFYSGGCTAVSCPANSKGSNVPSGCTCNAGYVGSISAASSSPFYSGSCVATCSLFSCPKGYQPKAGSTVGNDLATRLRFYHSTCEAVACPAFSTGKDVASGCTCDAGRVPGPLHGNGAQGLQVSCRLLRHHLGHLCGAFLQRQLSACSMPCSLNRKQRAERLRVQCRLRNLARSFGRGSTEFNQRSGSLSLSAANWPNETCDEKSLAAHPRRARSRRLRSWAKSMCQCGYEEVPLGM
ncbi:MEGF11 [Symbiodinium sp. CCMP2456]|nr:MEGF11 [Symbiodinium sp. CCMP2456]